jgi:hypothetical protein
MGRIPCGVPIPIKVRALDIEDGDLSDRVVVWHRYPAWRGGAGEIIGATGAGCELGWHWLDFEVTDSAGDKTVMTIMVEVVPGPAEGSFRSIVVHDEPVTTESGAAVLLAKPVSSVGVVLPVKALTPVEGWWGRCELDLNAIGNRVTDQVERWLRKYAPAALGPRKER